MTRTSDATHDGFIVWIKKDKQKECNIMGDIKTLN